jgi:hypothetical protein
LTAGLAEKSVFLAEFVATHLWPVGRRLGDAGRPG